MTETVNIRMYRGILGDCFLLSHEIIQEGSTPPKTTFRVLIDCGVLQCIGGPSKKPETGKGEAQMAAVAADLMETTGGTVDLLIATHEHYDHLSGFRIARETFKNLNVKKLWLAWTEDPADDLARQYDDRTKNALQQLTALAATPALARNSAVATVTNMLQFYGDFGVDFGADSTTLKGNASCKAVIAWLKDKAGDGNVRYLKPGEVIKFGIGDRLSAYVLGPPRDRKRLKQMDPSHDPKTKEVYLTRDSDVFSLESTLRLHLNQGVLAQVNDVPFATRYGDAFDAAAAANHDKVPYRPLRDFEADYLKVPEDERIDDAWLNMAESLAMKIDGDVNNTSLALAFETPDEEVMLFPADAQVGNWLSWGDQVYPEKPEKDDKRPQRTIDDILRKVILYKVGHHASHNATLRNRGLELMTDPRLAAMIPVVETVAAEQKTKHNPDGWEMPYDSLLNRLKEKTDGRILRGDGDLDAERKAFAGSHMALAHDKANPDAPLWVEVSVDIRA